MPILGSEKLRNSAVLVIAIAVCVTVLNSTEISVAIILYYETQSDLRLFERHNRSNFTASTELKGPRSQCFRILT